MQFLVLGYDGNDEQALSRRLAVREAHVALGNELRDKGHMLYGVAMLNEHNQMIGSMLVVDFPSHEELDGWLKIEPYVFGDVWKEVKSRHAKSVRALSA